MARDEKSIGVTAFKGRCLALVQDVAAGRVDRVVLTRRKRPVAALVAVDADGQEIWGALRGSVVVEPGVDLSQGTGEVWDADR